MMQWFILNILNVRRTDKVTVYRKLLLDASKTWNIKIYQNLIIYGIPVLSGKDLCDSSDNNLCLKFQQV